MEHGTIVICDIVLLGTLKQRIGISEKEECMYNIGKYGYPQLEEYLQQYHTFKLKVRWICYEGQIPL